MGRRRKLENEKNLNELCNLHDRGAIAINADLSTQKKNNQEINKGKYQLLRKIR